MCVCVSVCVLVVTSLISGGFFLDLFADLAGVCV